MKELGEFVKRKRKQAKLTQPELAQRAGVGLHFIRELEGNKPTLRMDKVDSVLKLFGHTVGPIPTKREIEYWPKSMGTNVGKFSLRKTLQALLSKAKGFTLSNLIY